METIKNLWKKYKSVILYLIFGGLTTAVNIVTYALCYQGFKLGDWQILPGLHWANVPSNIVAWIFGVVFAYVTNKIWVFESKTHSFGELAKEAWKFFSCRFATGVMDLFIMWLCVDILRWNGNLMKVISNILVIILNYVASKLWIFNKEKPQQ